MGDKGHSGEVSTGRTVLVGNVGVLCSLLHGVTVKTEFFSTVAALDSRLAEEGFGEGIGTCGIN